MTLWPHLALQRPLSHPESISKQLRLQPAALASLALLESREGAHSSHDLSGKISQRLGLTAPPVRMDSQAKYCALARGEGGILLRLPISGKGYQEKIWVRFFVFFFWVLVGLDHKFIDVPTRTTHLVRCSLRKLVGKSPMDAVYRWISVWGVRWARISAWSPRTRTFTKRSSRLLLKRVRTSRLYSYILVCKIQMAVESSSLAGDEILNVVCAHGGETEGSKQA